MYSNEKKFLTQKFIVNQDYGSEESFFRLKTDGGEVTLDKLPFQLGNPLPETLECRVKGVSDGVPILGHNMPMYINEFYADGFSQGQEFYFRVASKPAKGTNFYKLEDDNGLQFNLTDTKSPLSIGQRVKCRFEVLDQNGYILRRSTSDSQFSMLDMRTIAKVMGMKASKGEEIELVLRSMPVFDAAMDEYDRGIPDWILTCIRIAKGVLPGVFGSCLDDHRRSQMKENLEKYRRALLYMLEGSGFLRNKRGDERRQLQSELTMHIEQVDAFIETFGIIQQHEQQTFIDSLLEHLKESGYIYHPNRQFAVMMILFRTFPELVNSSLGNIFDALMGWSPDTWKTEPFRQAFVEQLEIYINEAREDIDDLLTPETSRDTEHIEKVLTAIAIQQALVIDSDNVDMQMNMAFFYRCLSLLRKAKADVLLEKSYLSLMGVSLPVDFTWNDIKEPIMMMTRAAVDPPASAVIPEGQNRYFVSPDVEVEVGTKLSIRRVDEDADQLIPNGMMPGMGIEVYANVPHKLTHQKIKTIEGHSDFWNEVEIALFQPKHEPNVFESTPRLPDIDDIVRIEIDRVIASANDPQKVEAFHCKIVDPHFVEGDGIMEAEQLATYNLYGVRSGVFRDDKGNPLQFEAKVIDVDDNDRPRFSLIDAARQAVIDMVYSGYECYAVITKDNGYNYSAISENGFGLFISKPEDDPYPYRCGNIVLCRITDCGASIHAEAIEGPIDSMSLKNAQSLHNLLKRIAVNVEEEEEIAIDMDEAMSEMYIQEIIHILRYHAVANSDNIINAFDYLSFASLLARSIGNERLRNEIRAHRDMLCLQQSYAKNKHVFFDDIKRIEDSSPESRVVNSLANKLRIVACLGLADHNAKLWAISSSETLDLERELAQLVLSHNLLLDVNKDDPSVAAIKDRIADLLNVNSEQRNLKYYGSESQYVEFKSSLVYPAGKGKSGISLADPDKQEFEILHIVAGFMNTTGGTLYIGVSDDHYERGLDEDLKYYKLDNSDKNTPHRRSIRSLDNMGNYLQGLIDSAFNIGLNAGDYAKVALDDESSKGVLIVKVDPCPRVVTLDGKIYVRHSSKTVPILMDEEIAQFRADREMLYKQQNTIIEEQSEQTIESVPETLTVIGVDSSAPIVEASIQNYESATAENILPDYDLGPATSKIRPNVLHEYMSVDHFVQPALYLRFVGDSDFIITDDEWTLEDTDRLDLAISEDELNKYLVLVYEGENAIKVPIKEIAKKKMNVAHQHYSNKRLIFAAPMDADAGLYSLHLNSKGTVYERLTPVADIITGTITSAPARILEIECESSPLWESIPADKVSDYSNIKSSTLKRGQIGSLAKGDITGKVTAEAVAEALYSKF